jgi:hypothetical protein
MTSMMLGDSTLEESLTPSVNAPLKAYVAFLVLVAVCVCVSGLYKNAVPFPNTFTAVV